MSTDLDRDLRDLFLRHETDMASRGLTPPQDLRQRTRRRQASTILITSVAAVAIAVAALAGLDAIRASEPRPADPRPRPGPKIDWANVSTTSVDGDAIVDVRTGEATALPTTIASVHSLGYYAVAPTGDELLLNSSVSGSGNNPFTTCGRTKPCQVFIANVDGTDVRQLTNVPGGAWGGGWSPDGTTIVAIVDMGAPIDQGGERLLVDVVLIDVATGETTQLTSGRAGDFQRPHFSLDGQRILFSRFNRLRFEGPDNGTDLFSVPVGGGEPRLELEDRWGAAFSPDGETIVYVKYIFIETVFMHSGTGGPQLWLANADGSDPRRLENGTFSDYPSWSPDGSRLIYSRYNDVRRGVVVLDMQSGTPTMVIQGGRSPIGVWLDNNHVLIDVR
jgi:Tol biopolymer transport system component